MAALRAVARLIARLEGRRLALLAASPDVAADAGARSAGVWLALESRRGAAAGARDQHDAEALARRPAGRAAWLYGVVSATQAAIIVRALDALSADADPELVTKAESQLLADAGHFAPR